MHNRKPDFRVSIQGAASPELFIYDDIGPDWMGMISGETVMAQLALIGKAKEIIVRINSPGGDCFEAFAIYNALRRHAASYGTQISVKVDSLAASAASLVAMAGDSIEMAQNSMMMVHECWTITIGNKAAHAKTIEVLDRVDENLASTYVARTGQSAEKIAELIAAETWMLATEAVELGFADSIGQSLLDGPAANVRAGRFKNTPARFLDALEPAQPAAAPAAVTEPPASPSRPLRLTKARNDEARRRNQSRGL